MENEWYSIKHKIPQDISSEEIMVKFEDGSIYNLTERKPLLKITHWLVMSHSIKEIFKQTKWQRQ